MNPKPSENQKQICSICGSSISPFLIDNHTRHCAHNFNKQQEQHNEQKNEQKNFGEKQSQLMQKKEAYEPVEHRMIECRFCEFQCDMLAIHDHEYQCGARTDLCQFCGKRDTLRNLTDKNHQCQTHANQVQDYGSFGMNFHDQIWG
eukprot:UN04637